MKVTLDLDLFYLPCELISIDMYDIMESKYEDILHSGYFGAKNLEMFYFEGPRIVPFKEPETLNIDEVIDKVKNKVGCKIRGELVINRAPGTLKFRASGKNIAIAEAIKAMNYALDFSHKINRLQFGEDDEELQYLKRKFSKGNSWAPLEGTMALMPFFMGSIDFGFYSAYYMDVTPTSYRTLEKKRYAGYKYSASHQNLIYGGPS